MSRVESRAAAVAQTGSHVSNSDSDTMSGGGIMMDGPASLSSGDAGGMGQPEGGVIDEDWAKVQLERLGLPPPAWSTVGEFQRFVHAEEAAINDLVHRVGTSYTAVCDGHVCLCVVSFVWVLCFTHHWRCALCLYRTSTRPA